MKVGPWGSFIGSGPISFPGDTVLDGGIAWTRPAWARTSVCLPARAPPTEAHSASLGAVASRSTTG